MQLHVETHGHGPVRVGLVHGILGSALVWRDLVSHADPDRYTFLVPDLRGHGESDRAASYTLAAFADDLAETLPQGLDAVVGHSLGGRVLFDAVDRLRPARAVYLDPGFHLRAPGRSVLGRAFWALPGLQPLLVQAYDRTDPRWGPANVARAEESHRHWDRTMLRDVLRAVATTPVAPAAPFVPSTLVLTDDGRHVVPAAEVPVYERLGWDVERVRGVHHDLAMEDAARTMRLLDDVLGGAPA
ncbi:alpha/beta fold hydrolase [Sphingomonas sp. LR61]|uniref:alpha/beta fold hydrolase n=1 Tax=Sphingomonas sp. LR61 TaxID=3050234 RepID=UPI002FE12FB3